MWQRQSVLEFQLMKGCWLKFDYLIEARRYSNRSEAIRDLIHNALVEEEWGRGNDETVGTVSLVYDHHTCDLSDKFTEHQHTHHKEIISALHVLLMQIIVLKW